jgi:hypothetical protein
MLTLIDLDAAPTRYWMALGDMDEVAHRRASGRGDTLRAEGSQRVFVLAEGRPHELVVGRCEAGPGLYLSLELQLAVGHPLLGSELELRALRVSRVPAAHLAERSPDPVLLWSGEVIESVARGDGLLRLVVDTEGVGVLPPIGRRCNHTTYARAPRR